MNRNERQPLHRGSIPGMVRLALVALVAVLLGSACGGGDSGDGTPTPDPGATQPTRPAGRDVTDEEYLAVICTGLDDFWYALNNARSVEEIRTVVRKFIANLEAVSPAPDVRPFHAELLAYLSDSIDEPTQLATAPRPLPADIVRTRLAEKESRVAECGDLKFFAPRPEDRSG